MFRLFCLSFISSSIFLVPHASAQTIPRDDEAKIDFFERKVRPIFASHCNNCHSANTNSKGGLRVDDRNGLTVGGNRGPAIVPGEPGKSLLVQAIRKTGSKLKMPPDHDLTEQEIADITTWIKNGAAWPKVRVPTAIGRPNPQYEKLRKEHWAWQPIDGTKWKSLAATQRDAQWARDDIDRLVLAQLQAKKIAPVNDADRATLIRRVTFDLTGLPPSPKEVADFVNDETVNAFAKVVDRLLGSVAFAERWGRHWLDVARYGESTGSGRNLPYPHAWRYRDYVIDSFNADKPYDQFVREQIAGDLLPAKTAEQRDAQLIATGFLVLGVKDVNQRFKVRFIMDNVDEQIDTVTRAFLATSASCARCHDHKFDPIPTADYYALAGIFTSSDHCAGLRNKMGGGGLDYYDPSLLLTLTNVGVKSADPSLEARIAHAKAEFEKAKAEFDKIFQKPAGKQLNADGKPKQMIARLAMTQKEKELLALTDPGSRGTVALGVRDAKVVADTEIRVRGEAEKLGPTVPRGFLSLVHVPDVAKINPSQSGRLELAHWLASPKNPLTPRVMANRVWKHLFGQGIVSSVDNFGVSGDLPSNPELLDHLALRLIDNGWSVKKLIRTIVLSRTYQLGYDAPKEHLAIDPANTLHWRHSPRRLDAEEIRDAMLVVAEKLDRSRPASSPTAELKVIEMRNNGPEAKRIEDEAIKSNRRSVYLPLVRGLTPRPLEVFDFAEQGFVTGKRDTTIVAPQALYLLNDAFVRQQSQALAARLLKTPSTADTDLIQMAYRLTLGREANVKDVERAKFFLGDVESRLRDEAPATKLDARTTAWGVFTQALLASAEFRYVR
ncbi:MAG: DUF1553 domain-containing protein [Gemmataceae bacterium]|nr:DUF1553 domain-containing protein [Gemmataceae bacterium]